MNRAQWFIGNTVIVGSQSRIQICSRALSGAEANSLDAYLSHDAYSYLYSAMISVADAIRGIQARLLTWATVKLYYATFYTVRSILALDRRCVFYVGRKPYSLEVRPGCTPTKEKGQTHKVVLEAFRRNCSEPFFMSQPIEQLNPLDWLMTKREEANYHIAKFSEPQVPAHLDRIVQSGVRLAMKEYMTPGGDPFVFDPDHAILAYPARIMARGIERNKASGCWIASADELRYLKRLFKDSHGPIPELYALLEQ